MKVTAIIPARGGSKGIPKKNLREVAGKPLIAWSINHALDSSLVTDVVVSTDCDEIAAVSENAGAMIQELRPRSLAEDDTSTEAVLEYHLQQVQHAPADICLLLQPTSPFRPNKLVDRVIMTHLEQKNDSTLTCYQDHGFDWYKQNNQWTASYNYVQRPRRQDIPAEQLAYRETGSIYVFNATKFLTQGSRLFGKVGIFETGKLEGFEIDTEEDLKLLDNIMRDYYAIY